MAIFTYTIAGRDGDAKRASSSSSTATVRSRILIDDTLLLRVQDVYEGDDKNNNTPPRVLRVNCCVKDMKGRWFQSSVCFSVSSSSQHVDISTAVPLRGSYKGVWLM